MKNNQPLSVARFTGKCVCGTNLDIAYIQPHGAFWNCFKCFYIYPRADRNTRTQFLKQFIKIRQSVNDQYAVQYSKALLNNKEEHPP